MSSGTPNMDWDISRRSLQRLLSPRLTVTRPKTCNSPSPMMLDMTPPDSASSSEDVTPIEYDMSESRSMYLDQPEKPKLAPLGSPGPVTPLALEPQTNCERSDYLTAGQESRGGAQLTYSLSRDELTSLLKNQMRPPLTKKVSQDDSNIGVKTRKTRRRAHSMEQAN
ncbi:hypothetical protein KEM56_006207 [Ascosphaera pollenicola]|nr:hypothetical protein KEM56_006207 [Ascosphaera pollenicola]